MFTNTSKNRMLRRAVRFARYGLVFGVALALAGLGSQAFAQLEHSDLSSQLYPYHQPVAPYPLEMGLIQSHSSTAFEGAGRGVAAVVQAEGNYALSRSQAEILMQQARSMDRINDLEQTRALATRHELWREQRDADREFQEQRSAEGRAKLSERRNNYYYLVYQLSPAEFDAQTGRIIWPEVLKSERYSPWREKVEELFRHHLAYDNPQQGTAQKIVRSTEEFQRVLRDDISMLDRDEYLAAQTFILGLRLEAEHLAETV